MVVRHFKICLFLMKVEPLRLPSGLITYSYTHTFHKIYWTLCYALGIQK